MPPAPIGSRLKQLREARGLTVKALATAAGVPVSTYREWEYGRAILGEPYPRLARALGVGVEYLITGIDPSPRAAGPGIAAEVAELERLVKSLKLQLGLDPDAHSS
jgi:transcriptional regulator with XRE-family HTH domain